MAFKLVGDQFTEQRLVRKRRVAHLLAGNIPDDEAMKMRDGRYACLVCKHRPVFDTITMLSLHRAGQKHLRATHAQLQQQELRRQEMEKRQQQAASKPHQDGCGPVLPPLLAKTKTLTTALLSIPTTCSDGASLGNREIRSGCSQEEPECGRGQKVEDQQPFFVRRKPAHMVTGVSETKKTSGGEEERTSDVQYVFPWRAVGKEKRKRSSPSPASSREELPQDESTSVNYKKLRSAGWVLDKNGCWFKDPEVEFDSDEEEPHPFHS